MKTHIIAELGINHNGDIGLCKKMITEARKCGADSVKLQILTPELISQDKELVKIQKRCSFTEKQLFEIKKFAEKTNIEIFSSIGDIKSFDIFKKLNFKKAKISSSNLLNWQLHEKVTRLKIPIIFSTGDGKLEEIIRVVDFYKKNKVDFTLMHCISKYPAEDKDANLSAIPFYKTNFTPNVGFSDHNPDNLPSIIAVSLGSNIIEKHFTLDKSLNGPDHKFSLDSKGLRDLVKNIKRAEKMKGDIIQFLNDSGNKKSIIRRSIVFKKDFKKNRKIKKNDIIIARPKYYSFLAIDPFFYKKIIGLSLNKNLKSFEPIKYTDVKNLKL